MKHLPLLGILLAGVLFMGAGCGGTTTTDTSDTTGDSGSGTATVPAEGATITVTTPASGATISSPFAVDLTTKKGNQKVFIRVLDASGATQVTAEGMPDTEGVYKTTQIYFFGGKGAEGTVEVFHKDGATETDLVSIPVMLK